MQGLLETLDVAYVGADVAASAVCMDKVLFKQLMAVAGVDQVDYVGVREQRWRAAREQVLAEIVRLGLPVFVKPAHLGSSVGIVKVLAAEQMGEALDAAFSHDAHVIVEALAPGVEVECGVLGLLGAVEGATSPPIATIATAATSSTAAPPAAAVRWRASRGRSCSRETGTTMRRSTRPGGWS